MKNHKKKKTEIKSETTVDLHVMNEAPIVEATEADSIEDFIELKRLQNRILEKLIGQINHPENPEKSNK
jgi:hypothetical protein